jgi:hypothetical protein
MLAWPYLAGIEADSPRLTWQEFDELTATEPPDHLQKSRTRGLPDVVPAVPSG